MPETSMGLRGSGTRGTVADCSHLPTTADFSGVFGGRYRTRTDDLFRVKEARYQLRQSPDRYNPATASRPAVTNWLSLKRSAMVSKHAEMRAVRMWRSGSASPCQGEGREFESRHPLE